MASTDRQRRARVPPHLAWQHPGLPRSWTRVLERNPEAMNPEPLPGYVWLDTPEKVLHVEASRLEFRNDPPAGSPANWAHAVRPPPEHETMKE